MTIIVFVSLTDYVVIADIYIYLPPLPIPILFAFSKHLRWSLFFTW